MESIAIIGMACRFPAAPSIAAFWQLLSEGGNGIGLVPADRWDINAYFDEDPKAPGKTNSRFGGFIDNIAGFDADFFGISPREAIQMDPQQRILLELSHEALEDAGIPPSSLRGSDTAVYIGVISNDYQRHQGADNYTRIDVHSGGGAGFSMLANRLSYHFDFNGPSMAIDSACSSSLVAVYQACQALWTGQSELALAGGVNLILDPGYSIFYAKGGLLAPDGLCKAFAQSANGIGRSEGAGLVVLKRQSDALRDGDTIYAVIRGGAINHDGRSNGLTAPNRWAQEKVLRKAWQHADITGDQLEYVELHGTGTYIGDPIEANALGSELHKDGHRHKCVVGSVKTNIGHLEAAAGIAGLIKLALCIHHRFLVPSLWFDTPNPIINFAELPLTVNSHYRPWPGAEGPNHQFLSGISSFGLGGTNAHLVLQSAVPAPPPDEQLPDSPLLLVLSGKTETALRQQAAAMGDLLASDVDAAAVCMTALARRDFHAHRLSILGENRDNLRSELALYCQGVPSSRTFSGYYNSQKQLVQVILPDGSLPTPALLAKWLGQAPIGRRAWAECRALLLARGETGLPPLAMLAGCPLPMDSLTQSLWRFAAQYAMAVQLLAALPTAPSLVPEGFAQLAACCASGAISLADALTWLQRGLDSPAPPTSAYTVPCCCSVGHNPNLATLQWQPAHEQWLEHLRNQDGNKVIRVIVNIDAATFPLGGFHCLGQDENDYGYLFARLTLVCQLRFPALADRRFVRLPPYPWQRKSYWLPRPATLTLPKTEDMGATTVLADKTARVNSPFGYRLTGLAESDQRELLLTYLREVIGKALQLAPDSIAADQALNTMGIDSFTAVEIKNVIEHDTQITIPVVKFLDGFTIDNLVSWLVTELSAITASPSLPTEQTKPISQGAVNTSDDEVGAQVASMSMEQVNALLQQLAPGNH